ncbi:MAG: sucrose synthase [Nitrospirae bacterium]|nr:MAG: sucrose synthase [Nitrospirota bacterium]
MTPLEQALDDHRDAVYLLLQRLAEADRPFLLRGDVVDRVEAFLEEQPAEAVWFANSGLLRWFRRVQEAVVLQPWVALAARTRIARWQYVRLHTADLTLEVVPVEEYLRMKEEAVLGPQPYGRQPLELDIEPFNRGFPRLKEPRSIGRGVEFLNRHLASEMFRDREAAGRRLLRFMKLHQVDGRSLILNGRITDLPTLEERLRDALDYVAGLPPETPWREMQLPMQEMGFEPGWGGWAGRVKETLECLAELLEAPDAPTLERFISRIPMIFRIAVITPHGWFGQDGVLGRPDTGGQVVYILDQVRALEAHMRQWFQEQGVEVTPRILVVTRLIPESDGTTCHQRLEPVRGCEHTEILRVPFRTESGEPLPHWISRFQVWPYLEDFALEAEREILAELGARPDLVIGNYSDGNLVATILAHRLGVTQCNVAHALEKSKYVLSDLYWRENEASYHFSTQYTADLIAMNTADFIITSTYQEIAGTEESVGQYEGYANFTLPSLYRVVNGISLFDPKFNIVSPGAASDTYFPYTERERRLAPLREEGERLLFGDDPGVPFRGTFDHPERPLLFAMSRLDRIKNVTGLVEAFATHPRLRQLANLAVVGGHCDPSLSDDEEERSESQRLHDLFDAHDLGGCVRWLGTHLDRPQAGELYRVVADHRGCFVQPARFEAFGLTVVEAMVSGLPTFATCYGGPLEIIEHGRSGFHIDPAHPEAMAEEIAAFLERVEADPAVWDEVSRAGIERVRARYTWELYAERLLTLSKIYGFWRFVSDLERRETTRYLEMFYHLQYRPLAAAVGRA